MAKCILSFVILVVLVTFLNISDAAPQRRIYNEDNLDNLVYSGRSPAVSQMCLEARVKCKAPPPSAGYCVKVPPTRPGYGKCCMEYECVDASGKGRRHWGWSTTSYTQDKRQNYDLRDEDY